MNARELKLIVATVLLSATGFFVFWRLNNPASEPIRKSPEDKTPAFEFSVPRIGKLREGKVASRGDGGPAVTSEGSAPAPLVPVITEPPASILAPLPATLPTTLAEKPGILPPPIALPITPPSTTRQLEPPPRASLTYIGFAVDGAGAITAIVEASNGAAPTKRYNAREGDLLLDRFEVTRITPVALELEDTEGAEAGRKQTFPLKK